ncbi:nuclear transport factor 2 family protein [Sphingobium estronivorans]|uniref:nuclear transport factor 2 family protein n=1 Tax=Sphingobium estronivorans TaxID=1577690 RepID=UPI00123C399B|nr:nuclear transport factor 2 family protein [Sphingobium estronivorans]
MPYTIEQLPDLEDIKVLKHRYFRFMDTGQWSALAALFTETAHIDYRGGTYRCQMDGRDNLVEFLANSFNSDAVAMHHGHMPEITFTGRDTAEGIWYLEDIFIHLDTNLHTFGSAIYHDSYQRVGGEWLIARSEYDRVIEVNMPLDPAIKVDFHYLKKVGRKPEERRDVSHLITWTTDGA